LLDSTAIATIFLDEHLQIKRYTTRATRVMALIPSDVGRPISDLVSKLDYATLVDDAREVLRTLIVQEKEVRTKDGSWYLVRMLPYRTSDNIVEGLVITFIEIDNVKRAEEGQQRALEQLEAEIQERRRIQERLQLLPKVFMEATIPIILADSDGCITDLNAEAEQCYGWRRDELLGQPMTTLVPAQYHAQIDALLARCRQGEDLRNVSSIRQRKDGTLLPILMTVSPLTNEHGEVVGLVTIAKHLAAASQDEVPS
jgi:two-component system CheB/CheR fusion protein